MSAQLSQARSRVPRFAEAAVERARLTVVPRRASHAARVPFVTLVSVLLVLGVAGLLLFNTNMQQRSFKATAMEERAQILDAREQGLQMRLATLRDPQLVATRAQRMGMVPPTSPAFIRLSDGKVLGNPLAATSENRIRIAPLPTRKPDNLTPRTVIAEPPAVDASTQGGDNAQQDGAASQGGTDSTGTKADHKHPRRQHGSTR